MASYLQIEALTKSYGDRMLFADITFGIDEGDKIGLIAKNGTGKSTLLKIIASKEDADSGKITFRNDLRVAYLDQIPDFGASVAIRDVLTQHAPKDASERDEYAARLERTLQQLGISNLEAPIDKLSGGEKKRIAIAQAVVDNPELLILDEPTNHLDMKTKDILKQAIKDFNGTVIVVSHDREFLDGLVEKVYEFGGGQVKECLGGIYEFLEKKKLASLSELERTVRQDDSSKKESVPSSAKNADTAAAKTQGTAPGSQPSAGKLSYAQQREHEKLVRKARKKVEEAEAEVSRLELVVADIEKEISAGNPPTDIYDRHAAATKQLENAMSLWELASLELDSIS